MRNFIEGFAYLFKSTGLFFKFPKIIIYSIIPVTINMIIYVSSFIFIFSRVLDFSRKLTGVNSLQTGFWAEFFHILILIFSFLIILVICYFIILIIGGIISAPFNEKISLVIEENITGEKAGSINGFWLDTWLNIFSEIKKILFYLSLIFAFFLLGFIPLIGGIISVVLSTVFSFFFNALEFYDYPMTRRGYTLRQKIKITASRPFYTMGFGCAAFLLMFLPVINVLMKPLCVVSGTAFYFEKKYSLIEIKK